MDRTATAETGKNKPSKRTQAKNAKRLERQAINGYSEARAVAARAVGWQYRQFRTPPAEATLEDAMSLSNLPQSGNMLQSWELFDANPAGKSVIDAGTYPLPGTTKADGTALPPIAR